MEEDEDVLGNGLSEPLATAAVNVTLELRFSIPLFTPLLFLLLLLFLVDCESFVDVGSTSSSKSADADWSCVDAD